MVEIELDGQKVEVAEGSMVMHAAEKSGTYIPHFCYHKKLSIAANCRMCLVDIEKAPKPMPACATPVTQGMIVRTKSDKAIKAQQSVMEFLLINHPLDCPICDQGGECQLQDLAVGYGASASRYGEEKRVVLKKDIGPLISTEEMTRCIHCTRCVRFGQEIGGDMELGMINRGEHSEITTVKGDTVDSELSGNMIDICPVGALTSKPFRYSARTWELSRRKSISPHDSTGANLVVQIKNHKVMRVVPLENEAVNECWIADRDRFSYEALNGDDRLQRPMLKQGGQWQEVDWQTALEYVANGLKCVRDKHGASAIGALVSPHSTLEELHLAATLVRGLGSDNIDHRLRHAEFATPEGVRWLGMPIAALTDLQSVLVLGSNLRKDHPLFAQRIRQAARKGCKVFAINAMAYDWALPATQSVVASADWTQALADVAAAVAQEKGTVAPVVSGKANDEALAIARALLSGERKAILLGNAAAHHAQASSLLALAQWIAQATGATFGYLSEAANTVGAQFVGAQPRQGGLNAAQMLAGQVKALFLLNTEPEFDSAAGANAARGLADVDMVVTLSPFKTNMDISDVLLPIAPFTETSGSFVNAEGRVQSFHAVVRPLGETRPAWKVLRVLANIMALPGVEFESSQDVLNQATAGLEQLTSQQLSNATKAAIDVAHGPAAAPVVASIYQLDGLVRRAPALQLTADARAAREGVVA
ncbi:MAG: NADH-quinone oxidoreductase subunit G [Alicycliphilus sp.]|jgi:NADH-quinone oxidoreductase subunit G|uniref:NADH-quinone oxidoreductase n=1 Tax=Diaphorobacter limosus TaxID=3036128 RepID=A0ABZ0J1W6_9BURK|nr:NADH-quinone oxidoreductase subunit NuoG [Diaphorobacter sp. Y-1]MBP6751813.1 NADH-quinone oxidoreductase subunit G [Alicycliphilus sp.]MCA0438947.1 NADH-quinone oxidoreductase subunit NuoG [Pseudomonadota bacterium]MBP7329206.1 NADH-quinone oxidoreductase subunit G [Alicycliphilus sp.]TXJ09030.1 MAG: NADH-quinone oxidoreductase subunit G [Alicycliphilus sp.]WOO32185.1 NADH-quinone oxidoreductase subunit NuoG [Diaphorobacter sp. Y-1]